MSVSLPGRLVATSRQSPEAARRLAPSHGAVRDLERRWSLTIVELSR